MKRSRINQLIAEAKDMFADHDFLLPPWAHWSPAEWAADPDTAAWCREHQMGWDITDYDEGRFEERGLILFCLRNGRQGVRGEMPYAEKIMVVGEEQEVPLHYHKAKMEDIIVRGGGNLVLEMFNIDRDGNCLDTDVTVRTDGTTRRIGAGEKLVLKPGQSVTVPRLLHHRFYGEKGSGKVLCGEVSQVNDDFVDNYFFDDIGRFSNIEEDEPALHPLWNELPVPA